MLGSRFRQDLLFAVLLLLMVALLRDSRFPTVAAWREYLHFAVNTDLHVEAVMDKARGLATYSQRIRWDDVIRAVVPGNRPPPGAP